MKPLLLLALLGLAGAACAADPTADATAKFLAGLPVRGTALESFGTTKAWMAHANEFDSAWSRLDREQLSKIRAWAPQFLGPACADHGPMFYVFSGPDFLYANAFFPEASTYILCGIEPVGTLPQIDKIPPAALSASLANLRKALNSVLTLSFFITKDMKVDLTQTQLTGTIPVLCVFIARAGYTIDSVENVALDATGAFTTPGKGTTPGAKIVFTGASGRAQTLYYFSSDLADWGVKASPGFLKFCEQQGPGMSLLKAASYLMHSGNFSNVRNFILGHSKVILQDDSGIPVRFFAKDQWKLRYCGHYSGPIPMFSKFPQPEVAHAFAVSNPAPLGFGFGYQWHPNRSSAIIATPKGESKQ
jgi:hypothetical protein